MFQQEKKDIKAYDSICFTLGNDVVPYDTCKYWYRRFKNSYFDLSDRERPGQPPKFEDGELQELLDKGSTQTQKELAAELGVTQAAISKRLHAMGKIQIHELAEHKLGQRMNTCLSLLAKHQKKNILWKIVTGDEKDIFFFANPKFTPQQKIHMKKALLCIWWNMKGVLYCELLETCQTVPAERYSRHVAN